MSSGMDLLKSVKLHVPSSFEVPAYYGTATPQQRALALRFGAEAMVHLQRRALETVRAETHAEAVKQAQEEFELQKKAQEQEAAAAAAKLVAQLQRAEEAAKAAKLRLDVLEQEAMTTRSEAQKEARQFAQELLEAKEAQIRQLQEMLDRQMAAMTTKMESLQNSMTKTFSSSKEKGSFGEALMESFLKKAFDCDISTVSKEAQTADIRMTRASGAAYFWEIKNYTRMVNPDEVEKFRRDLRLHPTVRGGVLVSLRTGITGKSRGGDVEVEFLEDGRPILFLSNFMSREDPVFSLQGLRPFFDVVELAAKPQRDDSGAVLALQAKAALITNLLRSHAQTVQKHKNAVAGHRKRMDTMFSEFQGYILESEAQLNSLLRVAMGGEEATEAVEEESSRPLNPLVFKKEVLADCGEERVREFVRWLLTVAEVREGTQVELKDLLDRARVVGYGEKWVRGLRDDLFQESAWVKGARHLLGLRWLSAATGAASAPATS